MSQELTIIPTSSMDGSVVTIIIRNPSGGFITDDMLMDALSEYLSYLDGAPANDLQ